jgi:RHS repeat-associated protein
LEEGGGYQTVNVLNGSGNSVSKEWDGKDSSQKQVAAGNYRVSLAARNTGGTCGDDSDFKSMAANIIVTATQPMAKTWPACLANLKVKTESSVNLASGNLSHSQPLFTLPNSKFPREFRLSYNSLSSQDDVLGLGWTHTYNIRLAANNDGSYTLTDGDGEKTVLHNKGSYYSPQNWNYPALTISGGTYTLQHKDGITYSFDSDKKITAISDRNSNTISFTYTGNNLTSVTDPNGRNVTLTYSSNKINTISDPSSNVHTFSYSGQNLIGVSSQIVLVGTSSWTYTYYDNSFMHTKTDPLNMTTTYYYDSDNRLIQSIDPESKDRSFVYNPAQSLTQMTEKDSGVWKFKYDVQLGTLTEKEDPYGYKEKYGFFPSGDPNYGRLQHIEDQRGKRNWFTYDSSGNGNITSVTDALNNRTDYTYNSLHKITRIEYPGSPRPMVDMNYNAQGNLTYFKDPMGNETQFTNDTRGNLTGIQSIGNSLVNMTYTYDSSNYLRTMTDNRTGAQTQLEHDSAGNLRVHKDPMTPTNDTVFEYNGFSKVKRVTDPEGNIINFYYDLMGNLASMTDANLKSTSYEYNYRGQVTKITDALNNITQFAYGSGCPSCATGVEKLTSVTDARGKTTTFEYDLAGRLIKETDHLGKFKTYAYDVPLNKITKTDEDGVVIHYTHDDLYRLTQISYPNSTTATFGYDARGNMISAANPNISYNPLTYDLNNRLTSVLDSNGKTISYQYNALNQRTQVTTPDGRTITYGYDNGNRLGQITTPVGVFNISYDLAGRRQTLSYPNLVTTTYTPNKAGFLTNLLTRYNEQTTINSFVYTPDGMSNRTNMTDLAGVHNYTYDNTYQLAQATHPNMPLEQFTYDEVGNRLSSQGQAPGSGMSTEFVYDFDNRLIEVNYTGMLAQYKYDPFGRRIEKNVNGAITRYLYDGPNIVTEYDGAWNVTAKYTHTIDIDDPLTITQGANTYYYHKDGLGSIVNLTNSDGNVVKNYTYKSFGEIYSETGSLVQPFTFTGREYDPESGLYFYRARYYDPRAGRFLTKDPIRFAGGDVNLYRYLGNNPINRTDPSGLRFFPYHFVETFIGATIIGHGPSTAFMWALESVMTDFEPGSQDSPLAQDTNVHGLKGLLGVNDRLQTMEEYWQGVRDAISGSTERGRYGRACHTLQDKNAIGHRNETYNGELTFGHALWDLSPMETPKNIHDTAKYLWENAPPSLPRRAYQFIFGR